MEVLTLQKLAQYLPDDPGFCEWLKERLAEVRLEFAPLRLYRTSEVFVGLLGASQNLYQYWEKSEGSGYPVTEPFTVSGAGGWATDPQRLYSPRQLVEIALWYWGRYVKES